MQFGLILLVYTLIVSMFLLENRFEDDTNRQNIGKSCWFVLVFRTYAQMSGEVRKGVCLLILIQIMNRIMLFLFT